MQASRLKFAQVWVRRWARIQCGMCLGGGEARHACGCGYEALQRQRKYGHVPSKAVLAGRGSDRPRTWPGPSIGPIQQAAVGPRRI